MQDTITLEAIGHGGGGHETPADDYQGGVESIIRLRPEFPLDTLQGLDGFSHLIVTWRFHLAPTPTSTSEPAGRGTTLTGSPPAPSCTETTGDPTVWRCRFPGCSESTAGTCTSPTSTL